MIPNEENIQNNQRKAEAGIEYFAQLYGNQDETGAPTQTKIDLLRDKLLVHFYRKYGNIDLAESLILDVGCGYGWLLENFRGAKKLYGVDISHHAVEIAAKRNPDFVFQQGNVEIPISTTEKFDLVLAINVIEHLVNPEGAVESLAQVSKSGTIVIVHLPTIANALTRWEYGKLYESDLTHIFRPSGKQIRIMFEAKGYKTLRESYLPHYPAWLTKIYPFHPAYLAIFRKN